MCSHTGWGGKERILLSIITVLSCSHLEMLTVFAVPVLVERMLMFREKGAVSNYSRKRGTGGNWHMKRIRPLVSLLFLSARDAAIQRGVLLHAVCPGCLWLAHIPDEEAHMWTLSPGQILLVSGRPAYRSAFSPSLFLSIFPWFRILSSVCFLCHFSVTSYFFPLLLFSLLLPFPSLGNFILTSFSSFFLTVTYLLTLLNKPLSYSVLSGALRIMPVLCLVWITSGENSSGTRVLSHRIKIAVSECRKQIYQQAQLGRELTFGSLLKPQWDLARVCAVFSLTNCFLIAMLYTAHFKAAML